MPIVTELTNGKALIYTRQCSICNTHQGQTTLNFSLFRVSMTYFSG